MSDVVKFQRPSLDEEMKTAKEFIGGSQSTLDYFVLQRSSLAGIRASLIRHKEGRLLEFLDEHIAKCDQEIDAVEETICIWKKILAVLEQKSA